ncbi:MAG TPA: MFS transporter [Thermoanaerobaculia bacterium]|nr:MFS transporter [Thermoanaerobaculia bacterium]
MSTEAAAAPVPTVREPGFGRRMRWVTVLYFAQGFPFGIFREVWAVFFRSRGVSLTEIGMMELLGLPWVAKPLWAPLVDRYGDRRKWVAGCLVVLAICLALHTTFPVTADPGIYVWAVLFAFTMASATQDIAIDAHTIAFLPRGEEGAANGIRVSAYRAATIVAGGFLLSAAGFLGWGPAWMAGAGILLVLAVVVLRAPAAELVTTERKLVFAPFRRWLAKPGSIPTLAFVLLYKLGDQAISPMIRPFWIDSGRTIQEIAWVSNTFGIAATIVGALIGGFWTMRLGLIRGLVIMGIFQASSNLGYALVALTGAEKFPLYGASVWESFTQGLGTAAFLSLLMRLCDKEHAGVQYALLSALFSLARHVSGAASGWAADRLGFGTFALYTVLLSIPAFLLLPWVRRRIEAVDR